MTIPYKFIPGATITIGEVVYSEASTEEITKFTRSHIPHFKFNEPIPVDERLLAYCSKDCFVNWLIKIDKLEKGFEPFTIEIPINSPEEYWEVWHRMNAHYAHFEEYKKHTTEIQQRLLSYMDFNSKNSHKLWKYVDNYKERA